VKLSIVLSTQPASFSAVAYKGGLEENMHKIRSLGYEGVELAVRDPGLLKIDHICRVLEKTGLSVPAIGTGQAFGEEGLSFTHPERKIRRRAIDRIKAQIELASRLGAAVIVGLIRGRGEADSNSEQRHSWLKEALFECAASDPEVRLALEPINRYETTLICTADSAMNLIHELSLPNVGLLLDTFHMNIEEPDPLASIASVKEHLFHFHIADSNRWYPGAGHIDFSRVVETLKKIGYTGYISAEILPCPDPDTASKRTMEMMGPLVQS
jgi:sugar phosphate isomerase/epimerase